MKVEPEEASIGFKDEPEEASTGFKEEQADAVPGHSYDSGENEGKMEAANYDSRWLRRFLRLDLEPVGLARELRDAVEAMNPEEVIEVVST